MHAAEAVPSPLSLLGGGGGVTNESSYKRSSFSRIRDSLMHYLTGPEPTSQHAVTVSGLCGIEPLRDGQAHRSELRPPLTGQEKAGIATLTRTTEANHVPRASPSSAPPPITHLVPESGHSPLTPVSPPLVACLTTFAPRTLLLRR